MALVRVTARRVHDSKGLRPITGDIFHDELRAHSLGDNKKDVWNIGVGNFFSQTLDMLARREHFSLLANRLINVEGYAASTRVLAASGDRVREIKIGPTRFRSWGYQIYVRKEK